MMELAKGSLPPFFPPRPLFSTCDPTSHSKFQISNLTLISIAKLFEFPFKLNSRYAQGLLISEDILRVRLGVALGTSAPSSVL